MKLQCKELRKYATVTINNNTIRLQIDTASDISIISVGTWESIGKTEAYTTKDSAGDDNNNKINLLVMFVCDVTMNNIKHCYIIDIDQLNIMGIDWIQTFNLWDKPTANWCNPIKFDDVIDKLKE